MGMVSIQKLKDFRGYFIVIAFIIAAIVTPPDVISQLALAVPMCILYELGIWGAQLFVKKTVADTEGEEADEKKAAS
jgi:sec-independent protein translocase protein TatC